MTRYPAEYAPTTVALLRLRQSAFTLAACAIAAGVFAAMGYRMAIPYISIYAVLACVMALGMRWVHWLEARDLAARLQLEAEIRAFDAEVREELARLTDPDDPR